MTQIRASDLTLHRVIAGLDAASGSKDVVFSVRRPDLQNDSYSSSLWHWDDGRPQRLIGPRGKASSPKLSPSGGQVAYLARTKEGDKQLRILRLDGNSNRTVGAASQSLSGILGWSPKSERLLLAHRIAWKEDEFDDPSAGESRPRVTRYLPYKLDGSGIQSGYRTQCRAVDLASGTESIVASGDFDVGQAAWSPDGQRIAYVRNRSAAQRHYTDLWIAHADGSQARPLSLDFVAVNAFSWSPDGSRLALSASVIEGDSIAELFIIDAVSGDYRRPIDRELQLEAGNPVWHPDGERLAVVAARNGLQEIAVVNVTHGSVFQVRRGLSNVKSIAATADGLVFIAATMRTLDELYRCDWDGRAERRLSRFNRRWFASNPRPHVVQRRFAVPDGKGGSESVDAWLLMPANADGPFPVLVDMHGGPHSAALIDFASHTYWYEMVALGWMIVAPNCVGSGSYGFDFARRLRGHRGELDLPQHLAILQQLQREGLASAHAACAGKSYGGYLAAWALGHTEAFSSVVISAPVANLESHNGTSDTGYYVGPYAMNVELIANRDRYRALSPVEQCGFGNAAVLMLQGKDDQRCPLGQSEEILPN